MLLCSLVLTETKPVSENEAIPPHLNNTDLDQSSSSNTTTTTVDVPGLTEDRDKIIIITSRPNDDEDDCHHHHSLLPIVPIVPLPSNDNGVVIGKQEDKASTGSNDSTKDTSNLKRVKRNKTRIRYRNKDLTRNTDY
jgi:hypothetical protein